MSLQDLYQKTKLILQHIKILYFKNTYLTRFSIFLLLK